MTWGFGKFSPKHWKVSELGLRWDRFIQSRKCMSLKFTGALCHDNEEWYKIWGGIELSVQVWHEEFDKIWPEGSKISNICTLMGCFWQKYILFELKTNTEELCLIALNNDAKFEGKLICALKNDMKNLQIFTGWKIAISF